MSEDWDQYAEEWDTNEDVIEYSKKAFESLIEIVNPKGLNVLDFGCGTGLLTEKLSPIANQILALDSSEKMISVLKSKRLNNVVTLAVELSENIIKENDLLNSRFDLIVASSVCAFLPDYEKTLNLLKTLLVPNGHFVQWDWLETERDPGFGFTKNRIESAFIISGLEALITEPFSLKSKDGEIKVIMGVAKNAYRNKA
jgi:predicted TPR repeat methyltransferase